MDATATVLLSLACPALTAVCLYRSNHRKHRTATTVVAWSVALPAVIGPLLAAQHTQGWGVVGWLLQLATAVACIVHLSGVKVRLRLPGKRRHKARGGRTERFLQVPLQAMVQWGKDFAGGHRPFHQPHQTMAEHRAELSGRVLEPEDDRPEWERIMNNILNSEPEEEQPEYNVAPAPIVQTVEEH